MMIKLGVFLKGCLMEKIFDWFGVWGILFVWIGFDCEYVGKVDGIEGVELVLFSVGEILCEFVVGCIYLGVMGMDFVCEKLGMWE